MSTKAIINAYNKIHMNLFYKMTPWITKLFFVLLAFLKQHCKIKASHTTAVSLKQAVYVNFTLAENVLYLESLPLCNLMNPWRTTLCSWSVNYTPPESNTSRQIGLWDGDKWAQEAFNWWGEEGRVDIHVLQLNTNAVSYKSERYVKKFKFWMLPAFFQMLCST